MICRNASLSARSSTGTSQMFKSSPVELVMCLVPLCYVTVWWKVTVECHTGRSIGRVFLLYHYHTGTGRASRIVTRKISNNWTGRDIIRASSGGIIIHLCLSEEGLKGLPFACYIFHPPSREGNFGPPFATLLPIAHSLNYLICGGSSASLAT